MEDQSKFKDENPLDKVKAYLMQMYNSDKVQNGNPDMSPTLPGLQKLADETADQPQEQGFANGGIVGDDGQDFRTKLNAGTALSEPPPPQFDPRAGMPPEPSTLPVQAPSPVTPYLNTQRTQINKYGPEQQLAVTKDLVQKRSGLAGRAPVALGSFADALMQGVARAGNPGFADKIQGQQNLLAHEQEGALEKADTANLEHVSANQKLDAMDPSSPLSKVAQQTWGPLLAKNGFKPDQIANMPASSIAALTGQTVEALKAEAEAKLAAASLGLKTQEAAQTAKHQTAEEDIAKKNLDVKNLEDKRNALKETSSHPFLHPINAFKASGELGKMGLEDTDKSTSTEDDKALAWAQAHSNDPRAAKIKALHGIN